MQAQLVTELADRLTDPDQKRRFEACCQEIVLGRPTKYDASKHDALVIFYAAQGYSTTMIACEFGIARRTLYRWLHENETFRLSYKRARSLALGHWEKMQHKNLDAGNLSMPQFLQLESILRKRFNGLDADSVSIPGFAEAKTCAEQLSLVMSAITSSEVSVAAGLNIISAMKQAAEIESIPDLVQQLDDLKEKLKTLGDT